MPLTFSLTRSISVLLCCSRSEREEKQWPLQFGREEQVSRAETSLAIFSADSASLKPVWAVGGAVAVAPAINRPTSESQGPRGASVIGQLQRVSTNSAHLDPYCGGWGAPEPRTPRPLGRPTPTIGVYVLLKFCGILCQDLLIFWLINERPFILHRVFIFVYRKYCPMFLYTILFFSSIMKLETLVLKCARFFLDIIKLKLCNGEHWT